MCGARAMDKERTEIERLLSRLTLKEKVSLLGGTAGMRTVAIPRLGIPSLTFADGPHGLRHKPKGAALGPATAALPATAFPTASALASTFDTDRIHEVGEAIAKECLHYGVDLLLAPGVNIKRNPLCGRNFEYYSEDPLLSGKMGAALIRGLASQGVMASLKHFALNNTENYRFTGNSLADRRTAHELYLRPFRIAVTEGRPATVMCAYNRIDGVPCAENSALLTGLLREEWGFSGLVMSDWGAVRLRPASLLAGMDLEMPGGSRYCRRTLLGAARDPAVREAIDRSVARLLALVAQRPTPTATAVDFTAHHAFAGEVAAEAAVLLENDGTLPLSREARLLVTGDGFSAPVFFGGGSSMVEPTAVTTPEDAFRARGIDYRYIPSEEKEALAAAASSADAVLVFGGLAAGEETESHDREDLSLPSELLETLCGLFALGRPVVLVLTAGAPVELRFADRLAGLLLVHYGGQNVGEAAAALLFGERCPSGRLAETWPLSYADVPFGDRFGRAEDEVYREGLLVGYRYTVTADVPVRYPFGYGLSYTSFAYRDMTVAREGETVRVTVEIENTGRVAGRETLLLFASPPQGPRYRPRRELCAFGKLSLEPGEVARTTLTFSERELAVYDPVAGRECLPGGEYTLELCRDAATPCLSAPLAVSGESLSPDHPSVCEIYGTGALSTLTDETYLCLEGASIPAVTESPLITVETRLPALRRGLFGRFFVGAVQAVTRRSLRRASHLPKGARRNEAVARATFMHHTLMSGSLRSMSMGSGGAFPYRLAEAIACLAAGHPLRALRALLSPYR